MWGQPARSGGVQAFQCSLIQWAQQHRQQQSLNAPIPGRRQHRAAAASCACQADISAPVALPFARPPPPAASMQHSLPGFAMHAPASTPPTPPQVTTCAWRSRKRTQDGLHVLAARVHVKQRASTQRVAQRIVQVAQVVEHLAGEGRRSGLVKRASRLRGRHPPPCRRRQRRGCPWRIGGHQRPRHAQITLLDASRPLQRTLEATRAASSRWLNSSSS